jgi:hypothetical protein
MQFAETVYHAGFCFSQSGFIKQLTRHQTNGPFLYPTILSVGKPSNSEIFELETFKSFKQNATLQIFSTKSFLPPQRHFLV